MSPEDHTLVNRWVNQQDASAFESLVTLYGGMVYSVCLRIMKNSAGSEVVGAGTWTVGIGTKVVAGLAAVLVVAVGYVAYYINGTPSVPVIEPPVEIMIAEISDDKNLPKAVEEEMSAVSSEEVIMLLSSYGQGDFTI